MDRLAILFLAVLLGARGAWYLWMVYRWSRDGQPWGAWSNRRNP